MFDRLIKIINNSYAPYSNFAVAAIVVYDNGQEFEGVNVENISIGATNCAERTAIYTAIASGMQNHRIKEVHILGKELNPDKRELDKFTPPCGICRQVITEFLGEDTKIIEWNLNGNFKETLFEEYFPNSFKRKK